MGKMGEFHAGWILNEPGMELRALCTREADRAASLRERYGVEVYTDADELLKSRDVDYVVVVTTHDSHEELSIRALNAGYHVIVEKPMCMTYAGCRRMIEAARSNGRNLFVHQSSRWDQDFLLLKQVLESGKLGKVLSIQSRVTLCDEGWPSWGIEGMRNPWRIKAEYGGGMLFDWGPHLVDEMIQLMGREPLGVFGTLQSGVWSSEVDDYFHAVLRFDNDTVCQIECSNNARLPAPRWYVIGTKGTFTVQGESVPIWSEATLSLEADDGTRRQERITLMDVKESGIEGGFYRDLIPYLEGKIEDFVGMEEAASVVKVLEAIAQSSRENRYVELTS
jgi:predicted dehydrogenase